MATTYQTDINVSDAKCREIGRIVAYWSLLEFLMGIAVGNLKGLNRKAGRTLTLRYKIEDFLKELPKAAKATRLSNDQTARMNRLLSRVKPEHPHRNDVAHGVWARHRGRTSLLRFKRPDWVKLGRAKPMQARDLKQIADRDIDRRLRGVARYPTQIVTYTSVPDFRVAIV